jgi:putative hemin transport protein
MTQAPTAAEIRQARLDNPKTRDRDLAHQLGISEAQLVAAHVGRWATRIHAHPDHLMPQVSKLGEVMALTRNDSAVHERVGTYGEYHSGKHASMVLGKEIDLRIFAKHWVHGYAIEQQTDKGPRRTLQVFDAAGDAVHKVFLRDTSNHDAWNEVVAALKVEDQSEGQQVAARAPAEGAKINPDKRDILLDEWARMTDTHQFNRLASKLGMNRLGAYRLITGERWVRPLEISALEQFLNATSAAGQLVVLFVGNMGNIQIHWGSLDNIKPMGPWLNVLDERFNLHLRGDKIAEVYAIEKPTKRGPAVSVEAFDAEGGIILQIFGQRVDENDDLSSWQKLVDDLPTLKEREIA